MKPRARVASALLPMIAGLTLGATVANAAPPSTAFTYQASLADSGTPVNGPTAMQFKLWNAASGGTQIGPTLNTATAVTDGVFTQSLDFGAAAYATNQAMWLEVIVEGQSMGRTPMAAAPFALNTRGLSVSATNQVTIVDGATPGPVTRPDAALTVIRGNGDNFLGLISAPNKQAAINFGNINNVNDGVISYNDASDSMMFRTNGNDRMLLDSLGQLGVGTLTPANRLTVVDGEIPGLVTRADSPLTVIRGNGDNFFSLISASNKQSAITFGDVTNINSGVIAYNKATESMMFRTNGGDRMWLNSQGRLGIGTSTPATTLDVNGAVTIRGGADIVEGFDSSCGTAFEPGTVLVIDPANPGKLMCSSEAYDGKVAGVVSGANGVQPGIKLGQDGTMDGDIPVAMTGRVYVKCSTENGPIQPGDRLTTASLPGHAMKATDAARWDGAMIGKAMTGLDEGTGMVLVLVNLQ